ncbi:MAG TPA: hypothetical protein VKY19_14545 [Ktedonosporobacter sp.]|jgi:hypothetical protein|nr:hypothetical protein [Ktedonosporobacter sp.]
MREGEVGAPFFATFPSPQAYMMYVNNFSTLKRVEVATGSRRSP